MGGIHTNVSILKGDVICFARDIVVGGNDFTSAISKKLGVDQKTAEELKLRTPKEKEKDIADCVKGVFNDLLDEVKLSFGYYENQAGKGIDEVYVSGGAADTVGLEQALEDALGSKPSPWNPLGFMDVSSAGAGPDIAGKMKNHFAIAAGLALK
jgi:Tfp pilus assembly PilM family ATPase